MGTCICQSQNIDFWVRKGLLKTPELRCCAWLIDISFSSIDSKSSVCWKVLERFELSLDRTYQHVSFLVIAISRCLGNLGERSR